MLARPMTARFTLLSALLLVAGCDCGSDVFITDGDGGNGSLDGGGGGGGSNGGGGQGGGDGGSGTKLDAGSAPVETCDGLDNDLNGVIDDVDLAKDGVCDCLKIATLGYKGQFGTGDVFNNWLNGKSLAGAVSLDRQTLTESLLAPFQVLVVQDIRAGTAGQFGVGKGIGRSYSPAEVQALRAWVNNGGGIMTLIGYSSSSEVVNVNSLLQPYGINYGTTPILPASNGSTTPVTHWAVHPLTENILKIGSDNGYEVQGEGGIVIGYEPTPGNHDAARATTLGKGHVFVWCDEWITYDSEWTAHADYQVERFWLNSLKWLTPIDQCQVALPVIN